MNEEQLKQIHGVDYKQIMDKNNNQSIENTELITKYIEMEKQFINTKSLLKSKGNEFDEMNEKYNNITNEMNELKRLNGEQLNNIYK